jgi:hypothetical protein
VVTTACLSSEPYRVRLGSSIQATQWSAVKRGVVVGTINSGVFQDLVNLALATEMDKFIPDADHINALPGPLRRVIHDLETRADPAGDVAEIAMLKENNAALWARVRELEAEVPPQG